MSDNNSYAIISKNNIFYLVLNMEDLEPSFTLYTNEEAAIDHLRCLWEHRTKIYGDGECVDDLENDMVEFKDNTRYFSFSDGYIQIIEISALDSSEGTRKVLENIYSLFEKWQKDVSIEIKDNKLTITGTRNKFEE